MKRSFIVIAAIILLTATIVTGSACTNKEGELPVVHTGDTWIYKDMDGDGNEYTYTVEVTGDTVTDGKECYVFNGTYDPMWQGSIDSLITEVEKATYLGTKITQTIIDDMGESSIYTKFKTFEHPETSLWPLEVGKEVEQIESSIIVEGEELTGTEPEPVPATTIIEIEEIEDVTVTAGTFKCFKIVMYYEGEDQPYYTKWYSDKVKHYVKVINHETGGSLELQSYTL